MNETCAYCGQERDISEMIQRTLYYRGNGYDSRGRWTNILRQRKEWYCKDKPCAAHQQMAHEG